MLLKPRGISSAGVRIFKAKTARWRAKAEEEGRPLTGGIGQLMPAPLDLKIFFTEPTPKAG